jgi:hypothetical protein
VLWFCGHCISALIRLCMMLCIRHDMAQQRLPVISFTCHKS